MKKIASILDLFNKPINEVTFNLKSVKELDEISKFLTNKGDTLVNISLQTDEEILKFQLENKRNLDRKSLNILRNKAIFSTIN